MSDLFHSLAIVFTALFSLVLLGVGLLLAAFGMDTLTRRRAARTWPQAEGRIEESEIRTVTHHDDRISYRPAVTYTFFARERNWSGSRIAFSARSYSKKQRVENLLKKYAPGSSVSIYYDPEHPQNAIIERQSCGPSLCMILLGLLCWSGPVAALAVLGVPWWLSTVPLLSLLALVLWLLGWEERAFRAARERGIYPNPGEESLCWVETLARHDEKGLAIHLLRDIEGLDMKTARLRFEKIQEEVPDHTFSEKKKERDKRP